MSIIDKIDFTNQLSWMGLLGILYFCIVGLTCSYYFITNINDTVELLSILFAIVIVIIVVPCLACFWMIKFKGN